MCFSSLLSDLNTAAAVQCDISPGLSVIRSCALPLLLAGIITHVDFTLIGVQRSMEAVRHLLTFPQLPVISGSWCQVGTEYEMTDSFSSLHEIQLRAISQMSHRT